MTAEQLVEIQIRIPKTWLTYLQKFGGDLHVHIGEAVRDHIARRRRHPIAGSMWSITPYDEQTAVVWKVPADLRWFVLRESRTKDPDEEILSALRAYIRNPGRIQAGALSAA